MRNFLTRQTRKWCVNLRIKAGGVPITEFVGLSSKINSYIREDHKGGKTARGIKKNVITKHIKHNDYKNTIFNNEQIYNRIKSIRSKNHQLNSYELKKVSLSCIDDKHNATKHRTKIFLKKINLKRNFSNEKYFLIVDTKFQAIIVSVNVASKVGVGWLQLLPPTGINWYSFFLYFSFHTTHFSSESSESLRTASNAHLLIASQLS